MNVPIMGTTWWWSSEMVVPHTDHTQGTWSPFVGANDFLDCTQTGGPIKAAGNFTAKKKARRLRVYLFLPERGVAVCDLEREPGQLVDVR